MNKSKFFKILFVFALFLALTPTIFANEDDWAKITKLSGDVTIKRSGGEKTFKALNNMRVSGGDTIVTGAKSQVSLLLSNNSKVMIDENSIVNIASIKKEIDKGKVTQIDLKSGSIYNSVKEKLGADDKYEVHTPNAVAGIRGTQFFISYDHNKNLTILTMDEGIVDMFRSPVIYNLGIQDNMRVVYGETGYGDNTPKNVDLYKLDYDPASESLSTPIKEFDSPDTFDSFNDADTTRLELTDDMTNSEVITPENVSNIIYSEFEFMDIECNN